MLRLLNGDERSIHFVVSLNDLSATQYSLSNLRANDTA
jgi:hypothetical protein